MAIQTSYAAAHANFAKLCERVGTRHDVVIIRRRGAEDVALVPAADADHRWVAVAVGCAFIVLAGLTALDSWSRHR